MNKPNNSMLEVDETTLAKYEERFQAIANGYNMGSLKIESLFDELMKFSNSIKEDRMAVVEGLTEEEFFIFDNLKSEKKVPPRNRLLCKIIARNAVLLAHEISTELDLHNSPKTLER